MTEKHFFGTRHGKGPCDAEIGVVKCVAFLAIQWRRRVIANAQDLLCFGKQFLTRPKQQYLHCHIWHMFVHVGSGDVNRCRPSWAGPDVKAIQSRRAQHCFRGLMLYMVSARERSCFCAFCVAPGPATTCEIEEFCGHWNQAMLTKQRWRGLHFLLSCILHWHFCHQW